MTLLAAIATTILTVLITGFFMAVLVLQRADRAIELAFHDWNLTDDEGEALDDPRTETA